jgi:hypothetical protein
MKLGEPYIRPRTASGYWLYADLLPAPATTRATMAISSAPSWPFAAKTTLTNSTFKTCSTTRLAS